MFVRNRAGLLALCDALDKSPLVAIDTEFAAERRYYPRFDLLQVATPELAAAVDVHGNFELDPLFDRLFDPRRTVLLHAGSQDLAILHRRAGRLPARLFDTQVAAAMVGYGPQVGFGALVKRITGIELAKLESMTDWSRRPLTPQQIEYALDDVRYLFPLHAHLEERLSTLDRLPWFEEEMRLQLEPARFGPPDIRERWRRQGARLGLSPRQLAVTQEVAAWREAYAIKKDLPARAVLPDEVLVHLGRRQPGKIDELREHRQIFDRTIQECGTAILDAVRRGLVMDEAALPQVPPLDAPPPGLLELLNAILHARAESGSMSPGILAAPGDLERLYLEMREGRTPDLDLVRGWRYDLAGKDVMQVLQGRATVRVEPGTWRVTIEDLAHLSGV